MFPKIITVLCTTAFVGIMGLIGIDNVLTTSETKKHLKEERRLKEETLAETIRHNKAMEEIEGRKTTT